MSLKIFMGLRISREGTPFGTRDAIFLHQISGKNLARFYLCSCLGGTKNKDAQPVKVVHYAGSQWGLGADNHKINAFFFGSLAQPFYVGGAQIQILRNSGRAAVPRRSEDFLDFGTLGNLPDQSVLPASSTND